MVTTLHGTDITLVGSHPDYKPAVNFSINNSDAVTSVSQSLKDDTMNIFDIRKEIHVVPNFIDIEKHDNPYTYCERELMAEDNERIITHISNLRPVKRIVDVIEIFDRVQKKIPSKLIVVGEGPDKLFAEELCDRKGISERVMFVGNSSEVLKILCFSDLFLLPSESESFGLAALEAMACGVPVISSNTGGIPEVNIHNKSGFLSDVGNIEEMAQHALSILREDSVLSEFKRKAKNIAQKFDTKNIVPMYEDVYDKALNGIVI
jgi:N-acetyl-alpha-D-glucosaminyl L-malate synthase BshA